MPTLHLDGYQGLGLVDFIVFPHWGNASFRDLYLGSRLSQAYSEDFKIVLLTDHQYVRVDDDTYKIIAVQKAK